MAIIHLAPLLRGKSILLQMDNRAAVAYVQNQGGKQIPNQRGSPNSNMDREECELPIQLPKINWPIASRERSAATMSGL